MKNELKSGKIVVDAWTIEYRVWDGSQIIVRLLLHYITLHYMETLHKINYSRHHNRR
jgi:hypothetical protein